MLGTGGLALATLAGSAGVALAVIPIPQPNDFATRESTIFDYSDARTQLAHVGVNRDSVPLEQVPPVVRQAVLAAEDRTFYTGPAISPTGILRALKNNLTGGGGNPQGGSTITQQYVKNYYLTQQQSIGRKVKEALISIKTDRSLPKDTILQNYLNTIYFGRGSYGIETASRAYFGVPVGALASDPAKAAYLAALIQSPYYYSTAVSDPAAAARLRQRWEYVLDGMVAQNVLRAADRAALTFPEPVPYRTNDLGGANGYLVNAAMRQLDRLHEQNPDVPDSTTVARGGYTVVTTFRQEYMDAAQQAVRQSMATLDPATSPADRDVHVGLAAVDQSSGAVLGLYSGPDYLKQGFDDALQAAGPLAPQLGAALLQDAARQVKIGRGRAATGTSTVATLADRGVRTNAGTSPSSEQLLATPVDTAAAYNQILRSTYHKPHTVSRVLQDGQVIWGAEEDTPLPVSPNPAPVAGGMDGAAQWAWSVTGDGKVTTAVDMYATTPGSQRNRKLTGMTPDPSAGTTERAAEARTNQIVREFFDRVGVRRRGSR